MKISKANKGIGVIKRLRQFLPRKTLLCIYKSYVRPHLDYADIIYDQPHNDKFCSKIEAVQYNAALTITGAIRGTSRDRLYQELGLESLADRRWFHRLVHFFKIVRGICPNYLTNLLPPMQYSYVNRGNTIFRMYRANTDYFNNSFFPFCVKEWNNKLGEEVRASRTISKFKESLLDFIRPKMNSIYNLHDPHGLKLLTRLRLRFSHLREHKFRHNFRDTLNSLCSCGNDIESTSHYLLRCPLYTTVRKTLYDNLKVILGQIPNLPDDKLVNLLLYGNETYSTEKNASVLSCAITFLKSSERFNTPLF